MMKQTVRFVARQSSNTLLALGVAAALLAGGTAFAQATEPAQTGTNAATEKAAATPEVGAVRTLETAIGLAAWGRQNKDPDALITAARMMRSVPVADKPATGELVGPAATTPAPTRPTMSTQTLLAEARTLARGDKNTLAKIRSVESAASRGVISSAFGVGALRTVRDVSANSTWRFTVDARGGLPLRLLAVGDGDTDIDMVIRDQNGNVVCRDLDVDHRAACDVTPAWTGRFTVDIVNQGSVWTRTVLISN